MDKENFLDRIARGRTDLVFELLKLPDWQAVFHEGEIKPLQWFVYYNDTTALKAVLNAGGDLASYRSQTPNSATLRFLAIGRLLTF